MLDGGKEQGEGREERKQSVAVKCRFKYITKDWRVHLCQVASLWEAILSPTPDYFPSTPTKRGLCRKFCWKRGLESEYVGFSPTSADSYLDEGCWASQLKSYLWSLEGPWKGHLSCSRFGSGRCPWISITCPGVGCGVLERSSKRSRGPPGWSVPIS